MVEQQVCTLPSEGSSAALTVEVLQCAEQFAALEQDWDRMIEGAGIQHPFMSHAWLRTWWESFGMQTGELRVVVVRDESRLVAAAPMVVRRTRMYGMPVRVLETLYNYHTPRFEFPVCAHHDEAYRLLWQAVSEIPCDIVVLKQFLTDSPGLEAFRELAQSDGWIAGEWAAPCSPYVPLEPDHDQVLMRLKGKERYSLRKRQSKLAELGPVDVEVLTSSEHVADGMMDGIRIEAAAWKGQSGTAMRSDPAVEEFYTRFAHEAARKGWLRLVFLRVGGKRISFDYVLDYKTTLYGVKVGYDPDYHVYSPGHTLLNLILKDGCARNRMEYDFLGVDDEWKLMWTRHARTHRWLFLFRSGFKRELLHTLKFQAQPWIKRLIGSIRASRYAES